VKCHLANEWGKNETVCNCWCDSGWPLRGWHGDFVELADPGTEHHG
jgi:hypothetical protein